MEVVQKQLRLNLTEKLIQIDSGFSAGVDEAGRGCLAGPVAAAAVILPQDYDLAGLGDSKKLSPDLRNKLAPKIKNCAIAWSIGVVWPKRIDEVNILRASLEAMAHAVRTLKVQATKLLIDGNQKIPHDIFIMSGFRDQIPCQQTIVGGDSLIPSISAASILAKTFRDRLMASLAKKWAGYGFEKHKGYGTREHYKALAALGPCPMHRLTFKGVAAKSSCISNELYNYGKK